MSNQATNANPEPRREARRPLAGKASIVTGASRGIGAATARAFAAAGAAVVLAARTEHEIEQVASVIVAADGEAVAVATDVTDPAAVQRLVQRALDAYGRLDVAFNDAGAGHMPVPLAELALEDFDRALAVNARGIFLSMKYEIEVAANGVGLRPAELSTVEAAAIPLTGSTALQLLDRLDLSAGDSVLVHGGAGGVGSLLVQLAHASGIQVAASASAARHPLLRELGVEIVLDREQPDLFARATCQLGRCFNGVADLVGGELLARSLRVLEDGGSAASIVGLQGDLEDAIDRNLRLHGVLVHPERATLGRLSDAVQRGALRPIVDAVIDIDSIADAHRRFETGHGQGKIVLRWPRRSEMEK